VCTNIHNSNCLTSITFELTDDYYRSWIASFEDGRGVNHIFVIEGMIVWRAFTIYRDVTVATPPTSGIVPIWSVEMIASRASWMISVLGRHPRIDDDGLMLCCLYIERKILIFDICYIYIYIITCCYNYMLL